MAVQDDLVCRQEEGVEGGLGVAGERLQALAAAGDSSSPWLTPRNEKGDGRAPIVGS